MSAASTDTRAAILENAIDLVQARGFDSFSFRDLAERVGVKSASIHYHFATKEDLGVAVIEALSACSSGSCEALEREHARPAARLRALLESHGAASCGGAKVCPLGSLLSSFGALPARMQEALKKAQETMRARLTRWLEEGREAGELRFPGSAYDQAMLVQAVLQHGMQQARACSGDRLGPLFSHLLATMVIG